MASRCGFKVVDGKIVQVIVDIEWDMGFNKDAKLEYINRLYKALDTKGCNNIIDVTTANTTSQSGYKLSPFNIYRNGESVEDLYKRHKVEHDLDNITKILYYDWLYLTSLSEMHFSMIKSYDCYTDIFHRPGNVRACQAKTCAIAKLLMQQNMLSIINNTKEFCKWRFENISIIS